MDYSISLCNRIVLASNHKNNIPNSRKTHKTCARKGSIRFGVIKNYKQSDFQDFQGYAKPSRLLPATELNVCTETLHQKALKSLNVASHRSLFKIKLWTSNASGSSLSDSNAGILICLIDTKGGSILLRIPVILNSNSIQSFDTAEHETLHFQRGSIDEFTFEGPNFGRLEALWVSTDSGQWRLGGVSLTVICSCQPSLGGNDDEQIQCTGFQYEFEVDNVSLGEGSDTSMVELRPCLVSELSEVDPLSLFTKSPLQSTSLLPGSGISNEESMREYADLKLSLLSYDIILIIVGATVVNFSAGENASFAFFIGGIGGFLYLLLLQRSVDGLPASPSVSDNADGIDSPQSGGFKSSVSSLALVIGIGFLAVKFSSTPEESSMLTPKYLLFGMMGFLACKVSVVFAAFKPMRSLGLNLKEND